MAALGQLFMMAFCLLCGYFLCKLEYLEYKSIFPLNALLIQCALPCMIISSVGGIDLELARAQAPATFALAFAQFFSFIPVTLLLAKLMRVPRQELNSYYFMGVCTNTGFIAMPVIASVYGEQTLILSAIYVLVSNLFVGSFGFGLLESARDGRYGLGKFHIGLKTLKNPPLIASIIAIVMLFAGIQLPDLAQDSLKMMGSICTPLAMVITGIIIASASLKSMFSNWRVYGVFLLKMLPCAIVACLIVAQFTSDPAVLGAFTIMYAAPIGSMAPAFAMNYEQDEVLAAQGTVITTLSSFAIFPVLVAFMAML